MLKVVSIFSKTLKLTLVLATIIFVNSHSQLLETKAANINLNKSLDLATMSEMVNNLSEEDLIYSLELPEAEENIIDELEYIPEVANFLDTSHYEVLQTIEGQMTGYVYNCPLCSGKLACMPSLDLTDGKTTYEDATFGTVRIVASSTTIPCGTIVRFESSRLSDLPIIAIVLDRGVGGTTLDLLAESESYALNNIGRSAIVYDILRLGWEG